MTIIELSREFHISQNAIKGWIEKGLVRLVNGEVCFEDFKREYEKYRKFMAHEIISLTEFGIARHYYYRVLHKMREGGVKMPVVEVHFGRRVVYAANEDELVQWLIEHKDLYEEYRKEFRREELIRNKRQAKRRKEKIREQNGWDPFQIISDEKFEANLSAMSDYQYLNRMDFYSDYLGTGKESVI